MLKISALDRRHDNGLQTRIQRGLQHCHPVRVEFGGVEMAMSVDQHSSISIARDSTNARIGTDLASFQDLQL